MFVSASLVRRFARLASLFGFVRAVFRHVVRAASKQNVFECVEIDDDSRVVIDRFSYFCGKRFDLEPLRRAVAAASQQRAVAYVVVGGDGFLLANVREADAHCDVLVRPVDPQLARKHNKVCFFFRFLYCFVCVFD